MTTDELLDAIRALSLPSRAYEDALRARERDYKASEKEHAALGRILSRKVKRRFERALRGTTPDKTPSVEIFVRGYLVNWTPGRKEPVQPYIHLTIGYYCRTERCVIDLQYTPTTAAALDDFCERWIAWIKATP